ncbi:hypothetical protein B6U99_07060 [Candidatus Geothermarchaeota archaeon ex4572_27]|nr:MAG: hypothetical protein B6U99_07060 [Candidatus Geothermarchaeota archaeon ex4572_27]
MFKVRARDLQGRLGELRARSGVVETPALLPVVNPLRQVVEPRELYEMGFKAVITNAYSLYKHRREEAVEKGVHGVLGYQGVVMTDSGAYQLLVYGGVDVGPDEIVRFQEEIGSDIAVILDVPTGFRASRAKAEETVRATLERARRLFEEPRRGGTLWVGPVQGGNWLDLVKASAEELSKLPFHVYALGSPTEVMEQYMFDVLVDMIATAKQHLPPEKPFHLFGAGHPMMFALAVALGCDTFDSASYAIYARQGRYLYEGGTLRLEDLEYLPCSCPICSSMTARELKSMEREEAERALAKHNLYACLAELRRVKQAIVEGRLWELLEARARAHPSMRRALERLTAYLQLLERGTPISKGRGLFFYDELSLMRPEVYRFRERVKGRLTPSASDVLLLLPEPPSKPFSRDGRVRASDVLLLLPEPPSKPFSRDGRVRRLLREVEGLRGKVQVCFYTAPLGVVPLELDEG